MPWFVRSAPPRIFRLDRGLWAQAQARKEYQSLTGVEHGVPAMAISNAASSSPPSRSYLLVGSVLTNGILSLALLSGLVVYLSQSGVVSTDCLPVPPSTDSAVAAAGEQATNIAGDDEALLQWQLKRSEGTYQRHMELAAKLMGTPEHLLEPLPGSAKEAMRRAHPNLADEGSLQVFRREYLITPRYPCFDEERVGTWGEGGKWLCRIPLHKKPGEMVVYSIGCNTDSTFEEGIFNMLGVKSETFDPSLNSEQQMQMMLRPYMHFHPYGLGVRGEETVAINGAIATTKDIHIIMKELGHTYIDVFKIDCEGCEAGFVETLFETTTREKPILGQILMEIHNVNNLILESRLLQHLRLLGYRLFHCEVNMYSPGVVFEVAFIHETLVMPKKE